MNILTYEYIPFFENTIITGMGTDPYRDENNPPPNTVLLSAVTMPPELDAIFQGDWESALQSGFVCLYSFNPSLSTLELIPVDSWYSRYPLEGTEDLDNPNNITYTTSTGRVGFVDSLLSYQFFTGAYPTVEVNMPISWDQMRVVGRNIISGELGLYSNAYIITNTPMPSNLQAVYATCSNPESSYTTPEEAWISMRQGAPGVALSLGESWPPALPS